MDAPDPGDSSSSGHTHPVFHEGLCDRPGRDPFAAGAVASPRRPVVYRDLRGRRKIEFSTTLSLDVLAVSGVLGRGGRAKAGPLEVPSAANPRRGKGVKGC